MPNVAMNGRNSNAKYVSAEEGGTQVIFAGGNEPQCFAMAELESTPNGRIEEDSTAPLYDDRGNPSLSLMEETGVCNRIRRLLCSNQGSSQRRRSMFPWLNGWTRLEVMLTLMCLFLAVAVIALIIMIASKAPYRDDPEKGRHPPSSANGGTKLPHVPDDITLDDICLSPGCINAASRLMAAMDASVKPCDDFFDFACGNWNKMHIIPDDKPSYNTFSKLTDHIQAILKDLLEQPVNPEVDTNATIKAKILYASCLNETQIDNLGLEPINNLLKEFGGWPILEGNNWNKSQDVLSLLVKQVHYNSKILIDQWVAVDDKDSEVNIIQLDQPELGMPSPDYYLHNNAQHKLRAYKKFALDVAMMFKADPEVAEKGVDEIVKFEVELARITIPKSQRRDNEKMYNKWTIKEFSRQVPELDWLRYFKDVFKAVDIDITEDEKIIVYAPPYFEKLGKLFEKTEDRIIINYIMWRSMMSRINNLPRQYRNINNVFFKTMFGSESESARWYECVTFINENMGNALGRLFVEENFDEGSKETALEMIHDIRNAFYELLDEADWMDEPTRIVAKEKAEAISEKIGYPDSIFNDTALNAEYDGVSNILYALLYHKFTMFIDILPDRYFDNVIVNLKHQAIILMKRLRVPVDRTKWSTTPAVVNAFYSSTRNQIMFPAAILQPPFYSKEYPKSLNYGGIGMVIGHEITHGFDDRGRQYDKKGILVQWWDDVVIRRFTERAQCMIDQYSNYTAPEVDMNVNGVQTQGENIADNGGIKEAYRAYKKYANTKGHTERRLPGLLHYTSDQLFFINFAQVWCGSMRPEAAINRIKTGVHSPGRFRVIGTMQNLPEFSTTFNCSEDSYMNRKNKCTVW
ncbi:unnamed protein product [Lymnaea stagnalis]|uniref:Uncharacterized protein n=1 Tax=Lymnaea stagnalis TaxID=6523 RepID=A0AAV2I5B8_LYMST